MSTLRNCQTRSLLGHDESDWITMNHLVYIPQKWEALAIARFWSHPKMRLRIFGAKVRPLYIHIKREREREIHTHVKMMVFSGWVGRHWHVSLFGGASLRCHIHTGAAWEGYMRLDCLRHRYFRCVESLKWILPSQISNKETKHEDCPMKRVTCPSQIPQDQIWTKFH